MKKTARILLATLLTVIMVGCSVHTHVIGDGAKTGETIQVRQWYALWGLVPLNTVDTAALANADDYVIKTEQSATDIILNIFTGYVTVYSRTVTVTK